MRTGFKNGWYPLVLVSSVILVLTIQSLNLLAGKALIPLIHISLGLAVLCSLWLFEMNISRSIVKIWAGIAIVGGALGLLSIGALLLINRLEGNFEMPQLISHLVHVGLGLLIYTSWDRSVEVHKNGSGLKN